MSLSTAKQNHTQIHDVSYLWCDNPNEKRSEERVPHLISTFLHLAPSWNNLRRIFKINCETDLEFSVALRNKTCHGSLVDLSYKMFIFHTLKINNFNNIYTKLIPFYVLNHARR